MANVLFEIVELLDDRGHAQLSEALVNAGFEPESKMQQETLAALAMVGQHPPRLRGAAVTAIPKTAHVELAAAELIECRDRRGVDWVLTDRGQQAAEMLAAAIPKPSAEQLRRDERALAEEIIRAKRALDATDGND